MLDSYIEFYGKHGISPVAQDISDLGRHFARREALYRHLGLLPGYFTGKDILEVGPGSGHNSLFIASCRPAHYDLVEGNPTGVEGIRRLYRDHDQLAEPIAIHATTIEQFRTDTQYDIVICEGMI